MTFEYSEAKVYVAHPAGGCADVATIKFEGAVLVPVEAVTRLAVLEFECGKLKQALQRLTWNIQHHPDEVGDKHPDYLAAVRLLKGDFR